MEYFSKADHFVHLPEFPTYQQTIEIMAHCVFRLHNIPLDVISDQAPNSPPRYRKTSTPHWELKWVHHRAFTLNTLKYTHNTMTSCATGLYLFWVFAALEDEIIVSSVEHHLWCCSSTKTASLWLEMYARLKPRLQTRSERMLHCPLFLHIRAFLWPRRNSN